MTMTTRLRVWSSNMRAMAMASLPPSSCTTFDSETTMEGPDADPSPYGPSGAKAILWAWQEGPGIPVSSLSSIDLRKSIWSSDLVIAHNIKFDWQHLLRAAAGADPATLRQTRRTNMTRFWDTSIAEYILSAQISKFPSLDMVAKKTGVGMKSDVLEKYIEKGLRSQDVPLHELTEYALQDVSLTYKVMCKQWEQADFQQRILIMIHSSMAVIFAEAEYQGLHINLGEAVTRRDREQRRSGSVRGMFKEVMNKFVLGSTEKLGVNVGELAKEEQFNTPRALSMVMFGHPKSIDLQCKLPVPVGRTKYAKVVANLMPTWPVLDPHYHGAAKHSDGKSYLLDEAVLTKIVNDGIEPHAELASAVLTGRAAEKKATTYYHGLIERQETYKDDTIHHTLNVTATSTGRTSSANPNSQNQPEEVKEIFDPGAGHLFCEFDFRQLEVWALAQLSGDHQLTRDLLSGTDIHYETGKEAGLWSNPSQMTKDTRRKVKAVNFGLIYGGGPTTLAEQSGLDEFRVRKIIQAFYARYESVKKYHEGLREDVDKGGFGAEFATYMRHVHDIVIPTANGSKRSRVMRMYASEANTGRMYAFPESEFSAGTYRGRSPWSPTNIKNYPVQGYATADIVPLALVLVDLLLPLDASIATAVHDSGLLKVKNDTETKTIVDRVLDGLPSHIKGAARSLWDISFTMSPGISIEWKDRWGGKPSATRNVS